MNKPYEMTVKRLIETLLNKLKPDAKVEVLCEYAEELGQGGKDLQIFDADYKNDKFIIRVVDWL